MFGFGFWRKVKKNPNLALTLFESDPDCIVDGERQCDYQGPFLVADSAGRTHRVHIRGDEIGDVQDRIASRLDAGPGEPQVEQIFENVIGRLKEDVEIGFPRAEWEAVLMSCVLLKDHLPNEPQSQHFREALEEVLDDSAGMWDRTYPYYYVTLKQAGWVTILRTLREIAKENPPKGQPFLNAALTIESQSKAFNAR